MEIDVKKDQSVTNFILYCNVIGCLDFDLDCKMFRANEFVIRKIGL